MIPSRHECASRARTGMRLSKTCDENSLDISRWLTEPRMPVIAGLACGGLSLLCEHLQHGFHIGGVRAVRGEGQILLKRLSHLGRGRDFALVYRRIGKEI